MAEPQKIVSKKDRLSFQTSVETRLLYARLRTLQIGEIVTYQELSGIISQDVQQEGRGKLVSARKMVQRDDGIMCDPVENVGIKRLSDSEGNQSTTQIFGRVRRLSERGVKRLRVVNPDNLSEEERTRRVASLSVLAVMKLMGKPKTLDKVEASNAGGGEIPIARTLEFFRWPKAI